MRAFWPARTADRPQHRHRLWLLLLLGTLGGFVFLATRGLHKPLVYDEVNFFFAGQAVAETGRPLANAGFLTHNGEPGSQYQWALWHPPLYVYTLGLFLKLGGLSEASARWLGIVCGALTGILVYLLALAVLPRAPARMPLALLAACLFWVNPLTVQSARLLDIDGTVLLVLVTLLAFLAVRLVTSGQIRWLWLLMPALALALWAKLTTPFGLVVALALYRLQQGKLVAALVEPLAVALGGGALFLGSWWAVSAWLGMPFEMPFEVLAAEFLDAAAGSQSLAEPEALARVAGHVILWASPYLLVLFAWAGLLRARDYLTGGRAEPVDLVLLYGGGIFLLYLVKLAANFPKYHITMMPFVAVGAAYLLSRLASCLDWRDVALGGLALAASGWYFFTSVGDRHLVMSPPPFFDPLVVKPAALLLGLLLAGAVLGRQQIARQVALLLALTALAWAGGVLEHQSAARGSTHYFYGLSGHVEMARFLDSLNDSAEQFYVGAKDVAFYSRNRNFIDLDVLWHLGLRGEHLEGELLGHRIKYVILLTLDPFEGEVLRRTIEGYYDPIATFGLYTLWAHVDE
jgi:hypothetical protein